MFRYNIRIRKHKAIKAIVIDAVDKRAMWNKNILIISPLHKAITRAPLRNSGIEEDFFCTKPHHYIVIEREE